MIRQAFAKDAKSLADLWNPWIENTTTTFNAQTKTAADLLEMIETRSCFLVYETTKILGFASYGQFRGGVGYARTMEHTIVMDAKAQRQGAGRALLLRMEQHAGALGVHQMIAGVSAENLGGIAFHTRCGYQTIVTIGQAGFKFGRYIDLILMQKFLA
jgi:L-amino acid N-acyltransferase YncA